MTDNGNSGGRTLLAVALAFLTAFFFAIALTQPLSVIELGVLFGLLAVFLFVLTTKSGGGTDGQ